MKYTENRVPLDEKDKMLFYKKFRSALFVAIALGFIGFVIVFIDFITYTNFQDLSWYISIFVLPIIIFGIFYIDFAIKVYSKTKHVSKATVIDKKHTVDSRKIVADEVVRYKQTHYYYLFVEGKDKPIRVDADIFHFFQKQDTMILYRRKKRGRIYRYEKNI